MSTGVISYVFSNITIQNLEQLRNFMFVTVPRNKRLYSIYYDPIGKVVTMNTKETSYSTDTFNVLKDLLVKQYPDPPAEDPAEISPTDASGNSVFSPSVYGYFSSSTAIDGNVVISKNTSLTRNMYYNNLTINAGCNLKTNGWRIVVADTLNLYGTISNDGGDASGVVAGVPSAPVYTTYLGTSMPGGAGLTTTGPGNSGAASPYSCTGGYGNTGGSVGNLTGGTSGTYMPISAVDGGLNTLSTMPIAFLGRLISNNFYLMGGSSGGGGACSKGNASTVKSGAGAAGGGLLIVAAKTIQGSGKVSAIGGNGSSATWTGTGTQSPAGIGGGGGGGGGCVIIISQGDVPSSITFDVSGGTGGTGIPPGQNGGNGTAGNVFIVSV